MHEATNCQSHLGLEAPYVGEYRALPWLISLDRSRGRVVAPTIIRKLATDVVRCPKRVKNLQVLTCHVQIAESQVLYRLSELIRQRTKVSDNSLSLLKLTATMTCQGVCRMAVGCRAVVGGAGINNPNWPVAVIAV